MRIAVITLPLVLGVAAACGGSLPPPNDEWSAAQANVAKAEGTGAAGVNDAKLHLQFAREALNQSKDILNTDPKRAGTLILVANAEAQLAISLTKAVEAETAAQKAQADVQKVKGGI
jgi:hypothetical protein